MKNVSQKVTSLVIEIIGWCLLVIGFAALFLPGPGLLSIFAGLTLLATRYDWAERQLDPVRKAALKAAHEGVASLPKLIFSCLVTVFMICLGIAWTLGPSVPSWWPIDEKFWLIGGSATGFTIIVSGIIAASIIIYSYIKFRPR